MAFDSLSQFVQFLEERKQLVRIKHEVDPHLEMTEIIDRTVKAGGPALLFEKVKGSPYPLLSNHFGSHQRMSWALGVEDFEEHGRAIRDLLKTQPPGSLWEKLKFLPKLIQLGGFTPKTDSGPAPCQEIIQTGDDVDLTQLPVQFCWPKDGGPFITLPIVITKDPETGLRNVGMYRMQVYDKKTTGMHWQPHKTGQRHMRKAKELGKKVEVAVALGGDPAITYCATAPLPDGIDEFLLAGFLRKKPVRLVKAKTVDLEVPADADFILEGYVDPEEPLRTEGPFGDHTGYYSPADPYPVFHVTAITRRKNAIYPSTIVGPPPMEDEFLGKATERIFLPLLQMAHPEIVDYNLPVEAAFHNLAIVSIKKDYPFHARKLFHSIWGTGQMMFTKCIIAVDPDVNVHDLKDVAWRVFANIDPKRDLVFSEGPTDALDHAPAVANFSTKLGVDATSKWPEEGYTRGWPDVARMSDDVKKRVDEIWPQLGLTLGALGLGSKK